MDQIDYNYAGQPLTAGIAAELIQELSAGRITERHRIVDSVVRVHRERGGLEARAKDTPRVVKKALSNLERSKLASNPSFGQWRIVTPDGQPATAEPERSAIVEEDVVQPPAEVISGEGEESVYLYYFESYRRLAFLDRKAHFQCKIGRSERDPLLRVLSQSSTALPEYPKIARLFRTSDGSALETAIHAILSLRAREVEDSPGADGS